MAHNVRVYLKFTWNEVESKFGRAQRARYALLGAVAELLNLLYENYLQGFFWES